MVELKVEVTLDGGASSPLVVVDQEVVDLAPATPVVTVKGTLGDKSVHQVLMSWHGAAGATMQVTLTAGTKSLMKTGKVEISPATEPFGGSRRKFQL